MTGWPFMLTAKVVAKALNCSEATVYQQAQAGTLPIPSSRFGRTVRFKRTDLEAYLTVTLDEAIGAPE